MAPRAIAQFWDLARLPLLAAWVMLSGGNRVAAENRSSDVSPWLIEDTARDPTWPGIAKRAVPYAPLMAVVGGGSLGQFSDAEITQIATTWSMVNSHGGMAPATNPAVPPTTYWAGPSSGVDSLGRTIGQRLKAVNPGFVLSNYRNGSYVSQNTPNEAAEVEARFPLAISVWNTNAQLKTGIDAAATQLEISLFSQETIFKGPPPREGRPEFYPFKASSSPANYSKSTKDYVAWIRIGDEILRIDAATGSAEGIVLRVQRGVWGTVATAHSLGSPVFQPIYIGRNSGIDAGDNSLGGRPDDSAKQIGLRYALVTSDPKMQSWLAEKVSAIFAEGYDVGWLDVSVSTWYNNANAYGDEVQPWNLEKNRPLTQDDYRAWQEKKNAALREKFPHGKFWINNVKGNVYFENGHDRFQLSGESGFPPVDGGSMEMYANTRGNLTAWKQTADMTLDFARSGFHGVAWSKGPDVRGYRLFSYATYLLAFQPGNRVLFAIGEGADLLKKPRNLFYYDLGVPKQSFRKIDEAELKNSPGLFSRDFTRGKVVVNPGSNQHHLSLAAPYLDSSTGQSVTELALEANSAAILFIDAGAVTSTPPERTARR